MAAPSASSGWPPEPEEQSSWLLRAFAVERDELYRRLGAARGEGKPLRATLHRNRRQPHTVGLPERLERVGGVDVSGRPDAVPRQRSEAAVRDFAREVAACDDELLRRLAE